MTIEDNVKAKRAADEVWDFIVDAELEFQDGTRNHYYETLLRHLLEVIPAELHPQRVVKADLVPMKHDELCKFGMQRMEFGKHAGLMVDEVPLDYLLWLDGQPDFRHDLRRYLASPSVQREQEDE